MIYIRLLFRCTVKCTVYCVGVLSVLFLPLPSTVFFYYGGDHFPHLSKKKCDDGTDLTNTLRKCLTLKVDT